MTRDMSCSTNKMAMPSEASWARTPPKSRVSVASRPELGSSNNSVLGDVARARATSTRRARPVGSESVGSSATWRMPTRSSWKSASSAGVRPDVELGPLDLGRHLHVLPGRQGPEQLQPLEGPAQAEAGPHVRLGPGHVVGPQSDRSPGWGSAAR